MARRGSSTYRPGARSHDWIEVKHQRTQEVVIRGWPSEQGNRRDLFGSLPVGLRSAAGRGRLDHAGEVGTGFTIEAMESILGGFAPLRGASILFDDRLPPGLERDVIWVRPDPVGGVRFSERTRDGRLRHPVWPGRRQDKCPTEIVREP